MSNFILGTWKCVDHDYRGEEKFNLKQAELIRYSILNIGKHNFSYSKAKFIENCNFSDWEMTMYDTTQDFVYSLEYKYYKSELTKMFSFIPVDSNGRSACYNECATFFLKEDTLITICGGYTFYWLKS
jgi:hypothetical protein